MVQDPLIDLLVVNNQSQGSGSGFNNQETWTAVIGVVPLLIFVHEASINTVLYLVLDFFNVFRGSGVATLVSRALAPGARIKKNKTRKKAKKAF